MNDISPVLEKYKRIVDPVIKKILEEKVGAETRPLVYYQIHIGGKRLRPTLAIVSCIACGGKLKDVVHSAAGLEILHNYTLLIDDIIDHSPVRRGMPTMWKKFGRSFAECAGADYASSFFSCALYSLNPLKILKIFSHTLKEVVDGEVLDILLEQGGRMEPYALQNRIRTITLQTYLGMAGKKTASLFRSACEIGGIEAKASKTKIQALKNFGWNLGIAFQIMDDVLDIYGGSEFGKPIGQDIKERKLGNILLFFARDEFSLREKQEIQKILEKKSISRKDIQVVIQYIKKTKAKDKAIKLAAKYIEKAKNSLHVLPPSSEKNTLLNIADYILIRRK